MSIAPALTTCGLAALLPFACGEASNDPASPGSRAAPPRAIHFTDVTDASGIDMVWTSGTSPHTQIVEAKGGGVALIDYDDDGDLDVFVPNGATMDAPADGPGCALFANEGGMVFTDVTAAAGLTFDRWGFGVAVGDYDADGHDDLYVTCYGENALLRNTGNGGFAEVTRHAGVGGAAWSTAASFGDLDGDGDLDLYVANYLVFDVANPPPSSTFKGAPVFRGPRGLEPAQDAVYENLGDGTFRAMPASAGFARESPAFGLGAVILDFDGDGEQDVYVGNDSTPNFLYMNRGGGFVDAGIQSGVALNIDGSDQSTMGIAIGDVSGNGFPDIFTTNFSNDSNTLHVNKAGRFFDDETRRYGLGMTSFAYVGWAAGLHDLDLDADEDLVLFNGHVYPNATVQAMDSTYLQPPMLYARAGAHFERIADDTAGPWLHERHCDRGAAFGDLDRDGDVDIVVVELQGRIRVLRNDAVSAAAAVDRWLIVELDPPSLGSRVTMQAGAADQTRWIYSGASFASASARYAHFGVPEGVERVAVVVRWPDGREQTIGDVAPGQHLIVRPPA